MVKEAFERLSEERRSEVIRQAMTLYASMSYGDITIRVLTAALHVNMATFYRWFDDKDDLCVYIVKHLFVREAEKLGRDVFQAFVLDDLYSKEEQDFFRALENYPDPVRSRFFFEVNVDVYMPCMKQNLQIERLDGHLRDNVTDEFVAYLYMTIEYNLQRYMEYAGLRDAETYVKLKDYMLHSLLPYGFMKECDTDEKKGE